MQHSTVCTFAAKIALLKVLSNEIDLAESGISRKDRLHELPHRDFIIPKTHRILLYVCYYLLAVAFPIANTRPSCELVLFLGKFAKNLRTSAFN